MQMQQEEEEGGEVDHRLETDPPRGGFHSSFSWKGLTLSSPLSSSKMLLLLFGSGGIIMSIPPMALYVCQSPYELYVHTFIQYVQTL